MAEPGDAVTAAPPGGNWRRIVPWLSGLLVLAGLIAAVLHFGELEEFLRLARAARPSWLLVALAFQVGTYFATAAVWQLGMRRAGWEIGLLRLIPLSLAKLFTDQVFPSGGLSGNTVILKGLIRRAIPAPVVMAGVLGGLLGYNASYLNASPGCARWKPPSPPPSFSAASPSGFQWPREVTWPRSRCGGADRRLRMSSALTRSRAREGFRVSPGSDGSQSRRGDILRAYERDNSRS